MTDPSRIPPHPFGTRLTGRGAIALKTISVKTPPKPAAGSPASFEKVPEGDRIPYFKDGGQPVHGLAGLTSTRRKRSPEPRKVKTRPPREAQRGDRAYFGSGRTELEGNSSVRKTQRVGLFEKRHPCPSYP